MTTTHHNDGGPAFPMGFHPEGNSADQHGMTLRDWFAGQALAGLLTQDPGKSPMLDNPNGRQIDAWLAANAYAFADAMLAARNNQPAN